jgi:phosphate acetyltransferase
MVSDLGVERFRGKVIDPRGAEHGEDLGMFVRFMQALPRFQGVAEEDLRELAMQGYYYGALMLQHGQVDALAGGLTSASVSLLRPVFHIIKPRPGCQTVYSATVMECRDRTVGDDGLLFFADGGVVPRPTVEQLSQIAVETARLARQITGKPPRVAMLSYSTKGSAQNEEVDRVVAATALARQQLFAEQISAEIDGELQVDAALIPEVAAIKAPKSLVAGRANVLIFPDLNAGNIAIKLVQRLAGAQAYGQVLLGLDRPVAELSRGAQMKEILGAACIVALQAVAYRQLHPMGVEGKY